VPTETASSRPRRAKIANVVFSYYPHDLRIRRAVEAALRAGHAVDVFCLKKAGQPKVETSAGLTVYRLNVLRSRSKKLNYIVEYLSFLGAVFIKLSRRHLTERYGLIHVNNMPDALVFAGLLAKWAGAGIVLDLHDPMPEVFMTKYGVKRTSALVQVLILLERASLGFADRVITTNIAFRDLFVERGCPADKIRIVMNAPDEDVFSPGRPDAAGPRDPQGPFQVVFNGTVVERHGLDTAVEAVIRLKPKIPGIRFDIYGEGDYAERLVDLIAASGAREYIKYHGFVHVGELAAIVRGADVGIIPNKRSVFTEINFPVRIFEYLSFRKPIIAPDTRGIRDYFTREDILLFEPGSPDDLAQRIHAVYSDPERTRTIVRNGYGVFEKHRWALQREVLLRTYDDLLRRSGGGPAARPAPPDGA
jgi:glycosyltransferase involved in cell wall biosynthesis